MSSADSRLHGVLIVDKPGLEFGQPIRLEGDGVALSSAGEPTHLPTSHDIVQRVRRWSGQRRIGHTGTLDPFASGVLALCLGHATRLVEYYQGHDKRYLAEIVLGVATDTYDVTGIVTQRIAAPHLTAACVEESLAHFRGVVMQTPPAFSALKQGGESLHYKARRGETVELAPRRVTFHCLELLSFDPPGHVTLRVHCSAGAYIRSLAYDLGKALGTVGLLAALRREATGPFTLGQAHSLDEICAAAQEGALASLLLPLGAGLDLPSVEVDDEAARRLGFGQLVKITPSNSTDSLANPVAADQEYEEAILAQGRGWDGRFLGVLRRMGDAEGDGAVWKAEKWFAG